MDDNNLFVCYDFLGLADIESVTEEHDRDDEEHRRQKFIRCVKVIGFIKYFLVFDLTIRKHATCPGCDLSKKVRISRIQDPTNSLTLFFDICLAMLQQYGQQEHHLEVLYRKDPVCH